MKILICFGTRPEAIKMAPVIFELRKRKIAFKICITAQHREMLDQVLSFFEIKADYDMDLMHPRQSLNSLSSKIFASIDEIFDKEDPDVILIHGDTTTSAIIALAGYNRNIKIGHVEAGLRTYNKKAPFPEEINRQLTARIADFHFAPTSTAKSNLLQENIPEKLVFITGNTVVDALHWALEKIGSKPVSNEVLKLEKLLDPARKMILVTGHRRESFGEGLENVCSALLALSNRKNVEIVYPVHLNPKVRETVYELLKERENIHLIAPVSYPTMLWLMQKAAFIISDSGGIQEEAPSLKKIVLVTRETSERMEGVQAGFSILVGLGTERIINEAVKLIDGPSGLPPAYNPYGDGKAAQRIVEHLINHFNVN